MKKSLLYVALCIALPLYAQEQKEVITGASYANDVYYSLENGSVKEVPSDNWDLGFVANPMRASIIANHPWGVMVYTYPDGDTSAWNTLDTTGMIWSPMYNSLETLTNGGAFEANSTDEFNPPFIDAGWGTYNMNTHNTTGDSLFVITTRQGDYKKMAVISKSGTNVWEFKFANLDGSDEQTVQINATDYISKNFVYYSLADNEIVDREPPKDEWELLFTKYVDNVNFFMPYPVTGIFTNENHVRSQEVSQTGLDQSTFVDFNDTLFSDNVSIIGSDWKSFNMETFSYQLSDSTVFFIKSYSNKDDKGNWQDSAYYKLYFTDFTGSSEGKYTFIQEKLSLVSSRDLEVSALLSLYPNPASDVLNLVYDHVGEMDVTIFDATGRSVHASSHQGSGFSELTLNISALDRGIFFVKIKAGDATDVLRFIKQ